MNRRSYDRRFTATLDFLQKMMIENAGQIENQYNAELNNYVQTAVNSITFVRGGKF